jgi:predicted nucleic acid-binding protein
VRQVVAYLLDANVVSEMMRPIPEPRVAAVLDRIDEGAIGLASITIWEILDGVGRLEQGKRRDDLAERFQGVLDDVFDERILDWTVDDARTCAELMERKRRTGEPLDDHLPDAMIAGMAVRRGLTVVTRNTRDFRNTGAAVVDPWTGVRR